MNIRETFLYFMGMQYTPFRLIIPVMLSVLLVGKLTAAGDDRSASMGISNAGISAVSLSNIFSAGHNQAATAFLERPSAGIMYSSVYLTAGINNFSAHGAYPFKKGGTLSITTNYFGYSAYRDITAGIGYSLKLAKAFSIGAQIDMLSTSIEGYGSKRWVTFEFGVFAKPLEKLSMGAHIYNPLRLTADEATGEKLPTIIKAGLTYNPNENFSLTGEYKQEIDADPIFSVACYYRAIDMLSIRLGFNSLTSVAFGVDLHFKDLNIYIGSTYRHPLGFSPYSALSYDF
jgi:hypothetical protein